MIDVNALMTFAFLVTGMGKYPETDFVKFVHKRSDFAAMETFDVLTNGYQVDKTKPIEKFDPLFKVTATFTYEQAMDATKKLVISIENHESAFQVDAHRTIDQSNDCGLMQVKPLWIGKFAPGKTCEDVKKNAKLAIYVGVKVLQMTKDGCSKKLPEDKREAMTAKYWLGAYASGVCGFAQKTATELCEPAGVCDLK